MSRRSNSKSRLVLPEPAVAEIFIVVGVVSRDRQPPSYRSWCYNQNNEKSCYRVHKIMAVHHVLSEVLTHGGRVRSAVINPNAN